MSITANEIFLDARALIDEYSEDGILISDVDVADLQSKSIRFIDMAQKELYKIGNIFKTFQITNIPVENKLTGNQFDIEEYTGTVKYYPEEGTTAKAYYFEVDGEGTVSIQENENGSWVDLTVLTIPSTVTSMTAYKCVITPTTSGNLIRLKFYGSYYYKIQNRCLYDVPFKVGHVPDYRPWVKVALPSDFIIVDCIVNEYPEQMYSRDTNYKWEGFKDLYINYFYEGTIRLIYKYVPATVTSISSTLEIDDITAKIIAYYVAARLANYEGISEMVNYFESKYNELKMEMMQPKPTPEQQIVNAYEVYYG